MCLPVLAIAGIAASLAGAGMNYLGQQKAEHALTHTFNRERDRQKAFEGEQIAAFQDSLGRAGDITDQNAQDAAAAARANVFSGVTKNADPAASGYLPSAGSAPKVVAEAGAKAGATANAATSQLAQALARIGGMGDVMQRTNIDIGRNSQTIGQIGGFKRGSLDVLQSEMDAAKQKGGTLRTLGGLAQSIGSMMMSGGMGGGAGAGGSIVGGSSATAGGMAGGLGESFLPRGLMGLAI